MADFKQLLFYLTLSLGNVGTMNVILIDPEEIGADDRVVLRDRRSAHIVKVLRSQCGDRVRIGIINGPLGSGRILEIVPGKNTNRVVLAISTVESVPELPGIDLILALPRPIGVSQSAGWIRR